MKEKEDYFGKSAGYRFKSKPAPKRAAGTPINAGKPRKSLESASRSTRAKAEALRMKKQAEKFRPKSVFEKTFGVPAESLFKRKP